MIANLFLHSKAFEYNQTDSEKLVLNKLKSLLNDIVDIVYMYNDENKFKIGKDFIDCKIFKGESIMEFAQRFLEGEELALFYTILGNVSEDDNSSFEELLKRCEYCDEEEEVNSLLVLNQCDSILTNYLLPLKPGMQFERYIVVYGMSSWIALRRQILGNHPENPKHFISEAKKYFPKLCFSDNCLNSLDKGEYLKQIPRKIVYYLACLNDYFFEIRKKYSDKSDRNVILGDFSGYCRFDEPASLEGKLAKKNEMTFSFMIEGKPVLIPCEPHLKISQEDKNYRGHIDYVRFHPRIYFAFDVTIGGSKDPLKYKETVFVGSIGPHL